MTNDTPVRDYDKFMLRLPPGLRDRIARAAKGRGVSMNSEIVHSLKVAYPDPAPISEYIKVLKRDMELVKDNMAYHEARKLFDTLEALEYRLKALKDDGPAKEWK